MKSPAFYLRTLKDVLAERQGRLPGYSMRAFARDLGLHHSTLSLVLSGQRALPPKFARAVAEKLRLSPKDQTYFLESVFQSGVRLDDIKIDLSDESLMLDEAYFDVIAKR